MARRPHGARNMVSAKWWRIVQCRNVGTWERTVTARLPAALDGRRSERPDHRRASPAGPGRNILSTDKGSGEAARRRGAVISALVDGSGVSPAPQRAVFGCLPFHGIAWGGDNADSIRQRWQGNPETIGGTLRRLPRRRVMFLAGRAARDERIGGRVIVPTTAATCSTTAPAGPAAC